MQITNHAGLHSFWVSAIEKQRAGYSKRNADFSATQLLRPAREIALAAQHPDKVETEANSMLKAMLGTALHAYLEDVKLWDDERAEQYLSRDIEVNGRLYKIGGTCDKISPAAGAIADIKSTSAWSAVFGGRDDDYIRQLSIYAWMAEAIGWDIRDGYILSFYTDWQASKAGDGKYPELQAEIKELRLLSTDETEKFIRERVRAFVAASEALPLCSDEELWAQPSKWAVMKKGRKTAVKLHMDVAYAVAMADSLGSDHYVEERPGESFKRCEYCNAKTFCEQRAEGIR